MPASPGPRDVISAKSQREARAAEGQLDTFCHALGVSPSEPEACVLYLTYLVSVERLSGPQVNTRLGLIDLARGLDDRPRLRGNDQVTLFLRGLLRQAEVGTFREHSDPIYREVLAALVGQTQQPTAKQARLRLTVLLCDHTTWPLAAIARLKWVDVDIRRPDRTTIRYPRSGRGPKSADVCLEHHASSLPPLRQALDRVARWNLDGPYVTFPPLVNKSYSAPWLVLRASDALTACNGDVDAALASVSRSAKQVRNRVALILGYGAALTTEEALAITQGDVRIVPEGLIVTVPGRRHPVGIDREPGTPLDPISAWQDWLTELRSWDLRSDSLPALLETHNLGVNMKSIGSRGLTRVVRDATDALSLQGTYKWQSLRWGAIRTAIRSNERHHQVAALAATSLDAVARHYRRESLIRFSVAGQLGL